MKEKTSARGGSASGRKKQFTYWLSVIVIGVVLGLGLQFVRAWTEPTTSPPNGNVGAPINTSGNPQAKSGWLGSSTGLAAPFFSDSNDGNYYLDPNGTARLNYTITNNIKNYGSIDSDGWIHSSSGVSAPWIYGRVSAPTICLNGDCRSSWPDDYYCTCTTVCNGDGWNMWAMGMNCGSGGIEIISAYSISGCSENHTHFPCMP